MSGQPPANKGSLLFRAELAKLRSDGYDVSPDDVVRLARAAEHAVSDHDAIPSLRVLSVRVGGLTLRPLSAGARMWVRGCFAWYADDPTLLMVALAYACCHSFDSAAFDGMHTRSGTTLRLLAWGLRRVMFSLSLHEVGRAVCKILADDETLAVKPCDEKEEAGADYDSVYTYGAVIVKAAAALGLAPHEAVWRLTPDEALDIVKLGKPDTEAADTFTAFAAFKDVVTAIRKHTPKGAG